MKEVIWCLVRTDRCGENISPREALPVFHVIIPPHLSENLVNSTEELLDVRDA